MPRTAWTGYERFCPLARALDVIGERWTLVIVQELLVRPHRYGELLARLPGIGTSVLADRLRTLERAAVVAREPGPVGAGVRYTLTDRGRALEPALRELRRWGVEFLADPTADGSTDKHFDVTYLDDTIPDAEFELVVDDQPTTLRLTAGHLAQQPGPATTPELTVRTTSTFLNHWAAGHTSWDEGRSRGDVALQGADIAWPHWLTVTGRLLTNPPNHHPADTATRTPHAETP